MSSAWSDALDVTQLVFQTASSLNLTWFCLHFFHRDLVRSLRNFECFSGYRSDSALHRSSLNEAVAAGMLMLAGFTPEGSFKSGRRKTVVEEGEDGDGKGAPKRRELVLCDPMCGSGTLLIEAALCRLRVAPGLYRRSFPFEQWVDFDASGYKSIVDSAVGLQRADEDISMKLIGNDSNEVALALARRDLERTNLSHLVQLVQGRASELELETTASLVVCNPPWGVRIDGEVEAWESLGIFLRKCAGGGSAMLLSGDASLTRSLRMRARTKFPIRYVTMSEDTDSFASHPFGDRFREIGLG